VLVPLRAAGRSSERYPVVTFEAKNVDTRDGDSCVPADVCKGAVFVDHRPYDPVR
jgi:hypothetical protein